MSIHVGIIIVCAVSQWFEWKSIVTVCNQKKKNNNKKNPVLILDKVSM